MQFFFIVVFLCAECFHFFRVKWQTFSLFLLACSQISLTFSTMSSSLCLRARDLFRLAANAQSPCSRTRIAFAVCKYLLIYLQTGEKWVSE